jgi:hypothetical protein
MFRRGIMPPSSGRTIINIDAFTAMRISKSHSFKSVMKVKIKAILVIAWCRLFLEELTLFS